MKRKLYMFLIAVITCLSFVSVMTVFAEEENIEDPCKVVILEMNYGDVIVDIESGKVGDIVTVLAKPYPICSLSTLKVNGVNLIADENGTYTFALVEGENVITAEFIINQEQIANIVGMIKDVKENGFENLFTLKNLFLLISIMLGILSTSGLLITVLKSQKSNLKITENMAKFLQDENNKAMLNFLKETIKPLTDKFNIAQNENTEIIKTMMRCFILSQENTPEARLAIINEISNFKTNNEELSEQVKAIINSEIDKREEKKEATKQAIANLEEKNKSVELMKSEEDNYGQI